MFIWGKRIYLQPLEEYGAGLVLFCFMAYASGSGRTRQGTVGLFTLSLKTNVEINRINLGKSKKKCK